MFYLLGMRKEGEKQKTQMRQDDEFMQSLQAIKKELISNPQLKDIIEQQNVSLRSPSHVIFENPIFNKITVLQESQQDNA